ncbi:hypothetical protein ACK37D_20075 [Aeromonas veronii]
MDIRESIHSEHAKQLDTEGLRNEFLVEDIFAADRVSMTYSHIDRIVFGGIMPVTSELGFANDLGKAFGVTFFWSVVSWGLLISVARGLSWLMVLPTKLVVPRHYMLARVPVN